MIFGHSLVLHAQELNLKPPCKEDLWAAGTPTEWQRVMQRQHPDGQNEEEPGFIEILKMFMNDPAAAKEKVQLDPFGSFIVLHGLCSIKWHLQQKAVGSLGNASVSGWLTYQELLLHPKVDRHHLHQSLVENEITGNSA